QLDKPYDSSEQVIYRTDLKDLKAVKKGRKRSKKERRIKVAKLGDLTWIWQSDYNGEEWDYSHIPVVSLYYSQKMRSYILIGAETRTILKTWRKFENGSHRTNNLREAFYAMNNFFTHLTNGDSQAVTHNVFRNDHFLNAYNIFLE